MKITNINELSQLATDIKHHGLLYDNIRFTVFMTRQDIKTFSDREYWDVPEFNFSGNNGVDIRIVNKDLHT